MSLSAEDVADFLLAQMDEESGDTISNLKLQKLLYYAQGFYLAETGNPLFREKIKRWDNGPVVPQVWHKFKEFGKSALPEPEEVDFSKFTDEQKQFLREIYEIFGQFSAWKLRNMTHEEPPWHQTPKDKEIPLDDLRTYFSTQIEQ